MDNQSQKSKFLSNIVDYVELFAIAVCVVILLFSFVFRTCTVDGDSMNQTLHDGEVVVVSDLFYTPKRGDIIVFHQTDSSAMSGRNKALVKRVIGIGGDTVKIDYDSWTVSVTDKDGEVHQLDQSYIYLSKRGNRFSGNAEYKVPEGSLFVLGDNRNESLDSRYSDIGFVDARRVLGKVIFRVTPFNKMGFVG